MRLSVELTGIVLSGPVLAFGLFPVYRSTVFIFNLQKDFTNVLDVLTKLNTKIVSFTRTVACM